LAFVVGFPSAIGVLALAASVSRSGTSDGAFPIAVSALALAAVLLVLGARSAILVGTADMTVRFFGLRRTTVRFQDLREATFGMVLPSLSYAIRVVDRNGRQVLVHANWWQDERAVLTPVCRALIDHNVPMDHATARVVSRVLGVKRPRAQIAHRAWLQKGDP
jgi:hypothetical protein